MIEVWLFSYYAAGDLLMRPVDGRLNAVQAFSAHTCSANRTGALSLETSGRQGYVTMM